MDDFAVTHGPYAVAELFAERRVIQDRLQRMSDIMVREGTTTDQRTRMVAAVWCRWLDWKERGGSGHFSFDEQGSWADFTNPGGFGSHLPLVQDKQAGKAMRDMKKEKVVHKEEVELVHKEEAELVNMNFALAGHDVAVYERWRELALKQLIEEYQAYKAEIESKQKAGKKTKALLRPWRIQHRAMWESDWPELSDAKERREEREQERLANVRARGADKTTVEKRIAMRKAVMLVAGKPQLEIEEMEASMWRKWKEDFPEADAEEKAGYDLDFLDDDGESVWTEDTDEEGGCRLTDWDSSDNDSDGAYDSDGTVRGD